MPKVTMHPDLIAAQQSAYKLLSMSVHNVVQEEESKEYGACTFTLDGKKVVFRVAKITPTKIGQFVAIWKRIGNGPTMPYDVHDAFDFFIISVRSGQHFGQFIFPKDALLKHDVISQDGNGGKRGTRVYPPWDVADNPQAKKTQAWQLEYFMGFEPGLDSAKLKKLL